MAGNLSFKRPLNIIFLGIGISLIIVCLLVTFSQRNDIAESYHKQNRTHTKNISTILSSQFSYNEVALEQLTNIATMKYSNEKYVSKDKDMRQWMMEHLKVNPTITAIILADNDGAFIRVPYNKNVDRERYTIDPKERPWFAVSLNENKGVKYTNPYQDLATEQHIYSISMPMISDGGSQIGVMAFDIGLAENELLLTQLVSSVPGANVVINREGILIMGSDRNSVPENLEEIATNSGEYKGEFYLPSTHAYYYYQSLGNPDWLVIHETKKEVIDELVFNESIKITYGILFALIVLSFCWWSIHASMNNIYMRIAGGIKNGTIDRKAVDELIVDQIHTASLMMDNIKSEAVTDGLTGLQNRRAFDAEMVIQSDNKRALLALIDIDNFKSVNDSYGHATGDIVLKTVSDIGTRLRGLADISLYRYGGEEIAVIFNDMEPADALAYLESWGRYLKQRKFREQNLVVTFSAGLTDMNHQSIEETINAADSLLYEAKRSGKDRVVTKLV